MMSENKLGYGIDWDFYCSKPDCSGELDYWVNGNLFQRHKIYDDCELDCVEARCKRCSAEYDIDVRVSYSLEQRPREAHGAA